MGRMIVGRWLRAAVLLAAAMLCAATTVLHAQVCGVPGRQGLVTTASLAPNSYYAGTGSPSAGSSAITLATGSNATRGVATNLLAGDLVLIIQMQDSSGTLEGNYEYAVVTVGGGAGATIQLGSPLVNSYAQSVSAGTVRASQVVRVPQYSAATLSGTVDGPSLVCGPHDRLWHRRRVCGGRRGHAHDERRDHQCAGQGLSGRPGCQQHAEPRGWHPL